MKILLTAVNAKYIHSNLGIYSLKAYADQVLGLGEAGGRHERAENRGTGTGAMDPAKPSIELAEYTINHQLDQILQDIFRREPDVIAFSCYIWNIEYIRYLIADLAIVVQGKQKADGIGFKGRSSFHAGCGPHAGSYSGKAFRRDEEAAQHSMRPVQPCSCSYYG